MGIWLPQRRIAQPQDGAQINIGNSLSRGLVGLWVAGPGGIRQVLPVPLAIAMEAAGRITPRAYGLAATAASASRRALIPNDTRWQPTAAMSFMHWGDLAGNTLTMAASEVSLNGFGVYSNRAYCRIGSAWADPVTSGLSNTATSAALGATYDGATYRVYGNGRQIGTQSITGTVTHASSGIGLGARANGTNANANGSNALLAIWDRALTAAEALEFYEHPWKLFQPRRVWVPVPAAGGTTYNEAVVEALTAADSQASVLSALAAMSEAGTAADSAAGLLIAAASLAESATAADTVATGAASYSVTITEAATAAEAVAATAQLVAAMSEALSAAESITVTRVMGVTLAEAATAADATNWGGALYSVEVAEAATLADAVAAALQALAAMAETASALDVPTVVLSAGASVLEILAAADAVAGSVPGIVTAALAESATAADAIVATYVSGTLVVLSAPPAGRRLQTGARMNLQTSRRTPYRGSTR